MRRALFVGSVAAALLFLGLERGISVSSAAESPAQAVLLTAEPDANRFELVAELSGEVKGETEMAARAQLSSVLAHEAEKVEATAVKLDQTRVKSTGKTVTVAFQARAFHSKNSVTAYAQR